MKEFFNKIGSGLNRFFNIEESGSTISREIIAGLTTFFAMVYIIFVNPSILTLAGTDANPFPVGAIFLATIFASVIGTLVMGLFANVPYAQAPGMGLNAFFTFTVCMGLGFTWQEALGMVFICGIINIIITVTKIRKSIIKAIPESLQNAIGGGIGLFIAYIGFLNVQMVDISGSVPALTDFSKLGPVLTMIGIIITILLLLFKVKGAILLGIIITTIIGIPMKVTNIPDDFSWNIAQNFKELGTTFGKAFVGIGDLFKDISKLPVALLAIFAFSLTDTFDTIGTFIGTGRRSGIFSDEDLAAIEESKGFKTKMERALFADSIATSIGSIFGTSNTTTYVESAAGIEAGGRTGLTSVTVAVLFLLCIFISPIVGIIPSEATSPALVVVGIMMAGAFKNINWEDLSEAIPAFFAAVVMALAYNISIGIAFGFIFYVIVKLCQKKANEIHPILWACSGLFVLYFILMALHGAGIF
ncbi:MAG: NCS2 family permease [Bacilli bacterium]|nr:NCS2 family permease [Bacilli bacterium]